MSYSRLAGISKVVLTELNSSNFITFKLHRIIDNNINPHRVDIYGFNRYQCKGDSIMDGLIHIKDTIDSRIIVPDNEQLFRINGKIDKPENVNMSMVNIIQPLDKQPALRMVEFDLDMVFMKFSVCNTLDKDTPYEKVFERILI
tara:strand:- start:5619 stop:6050 length:432 start_codon:yes stop_codon:yes gene_type:complete